MDTADGLRGLNSDRSYNPAAAGCKARCEPDPPASAPVACATLRDRARAGTAGCAAACIPPLYEHPDHEETA